MIVVAGESLIDIAVSADGGVTATPGGGPYNAARTIARLGQPCTYLGRLSEDRFGQLLTSALMSDGVGLGCPAPVAAPTTLAVAELDDRGSATYRFYVEGTAAPSLDLDTALQALPPGAAAVHVGTLGLVLEPMASTLEALVLQLPPDVLVMVDPNCRPSAIRDSSKYRDRLARILQRADAVKVSTEDLAFLSDGAHASDPTKWLLDLGPTVVLRTDGDEPVHATTAADDLMLAVRPVHVVDTVGAGDAFGGAFLSWWIAHRLTAAELDDLDALARAAEVAIEVAARTCERPGADPPRITDLPEPWQRALGFGGYE